MSTAAMQGTLQDNLHTHKLALIPKGIKAGDLRRGCEGLELRNFLGNYCVALNRLGLRPRTETPVAPSTGNSYGFPDRRDRPNHAHPLDSASRVVSGRIPRKKTPGEEKPICTQHRNNTFTHSKQRLLKYQTGTEPSSRSNSNRSHQRPNEKNNHNRIAIYYFRSIEIEKQSERPPKISKSFSIFRQCNRKLKTASESPEPFKPSLRMTIEMNEVNYRPIDSCINT